MPHKESSWLDDSMDQFHWEVRIRVMGSVFRISRIPTGVRCGEFRREGGLGEDLAARGDGRNGLRQRNSFWELDDGRVCSLGTWPGDLAASKRLWVRASARCCRFREIRTRVSRGFVKGKLRVRVE